MKTTKKILTMLLTFAMICSLVTACSSDTPDGSTTGSNGGEGNSLDIAVDAPDAHIDRNPDTDPPADNSDGSGQDNFDEVNAATIENAVVVSADMHTDSDAIGFSCVAIIEGYGEGYAPFTFSVPITAIEGGYDLEKLEDLTGAIVNIDFDGLFMESYPMQIDGVTKVSITGERADYVAYNDCLAAFSYDDCVVNTMYICEGWIVKAESASDDSGNAVICAMVQLGGCGVKDYVKLVYPAEKICNEAGEAVDPESIAPGVCFEFAYNGGMTSSDDGKAIFEILREDIDYVTIGSENVGYTAEQYAEFEAYFYTDK